jgi:transcriptional regulator with XRE-family HTH domain
MGSIVNILNKGKATDVDHLVSQRLKMRRLLLGFTQQELGAAVDVSIQQVQKYENGVNRISCGKLYNIAAFLNVSVAYFFEPIGILNSKFDYAVAQEQEEYHPICAKHENTIYDSPDGNFQNAANNHNVDGNNILETFYLLDKDIVALLKACNSITKKQIRTRIIELVRSLIELSTDDTCS